jgi:hypothetical protein
VSCQSLPYNTLPVRSDFLGWFAMRVLGLEKNIIMADTCDSINRLIEKDYMERTEGGNYAYVA